MRLLVTGASGFLGRNALLAMPSSWQVVALYRPGNRDFLNFLETHKLDHIQPIACDLTNLQQVKWALGKVDGNFESCLALASNTSIPTSIEKPIQDLRTNVIGLLHVLQYCAIKHLVYLSSGAVYMGLTGLVGPSSQVMPTLPYAISKLTSELYIRAFVQYNQRPESATILRFFGAYGPYEPPRKLYTKLIRRFAFEHNPDFTVVGDGENYIDAMYIDDAIRALMKVLTLPVTKEIRCVDLGVGSGETVNELVTRAGQIFGLTPIISHKDSTAEYIRFKINPQPFASAYQFIPDIPLEVGLRKLAAHLTQEESHALT